MSEESFEDQLLRLEMMIDPHQQTWDLSENDVRAIRALLRKYDEILVLTNSATGKDGI